MTSLLNFNRVLGKLGSKYVAVFAKPFIYLKFWTHLNLKKLSKALVAMVIVNVYVFNFLIHLAK